MHLKEGTLLKRGDYKIIRFISSGGFGCTYEAVHQVLNKRVAIKEFFPKTFCNREGDSSQISVGTQSQKPIVDKLKEKFFNEACSIAQLSHPNIVKVSDVFEENGTAYYVMDYIEGKSLGRVIDEKGHLSEEETLGYMRPICEALEYVHSQNRLHLDIKPGNIMLDSKGTPILIDFGASKQYNEESGDNTTTLIGKTPGFAPLEQMGKDVSRIRPATDIYSIGATLYKCLSGKTPLEANILADGDELDPLPENISEPTKRAIHAAMEVSSKKRPQTVSEFLAILDDKVPEPNNKDSEESLKETKKTSENTASSISNKNPEAGTKTDTKEPSSPTTSKLSAATKDKSKKSRAGKTQDSNSSERANAEEKSKIKSKGSSDGSIISNGSNPEENSKSGGDRYDFEEPDPKEEENIRVPKRIIFFGLAISLITVLALKFFLGGNKDESFSYNGSSEQSAIVADSTVNSPSRIYTADKETSQFYIEIPSTVKAGEEFSIVYHLAKDNGENFQVADIDGCVKLSGPVTSQSDQGIEYAFVYTSEKEGEYTIPAATVTTDGETLTSNVLTLMVLDPNSQIAQIPQEDAALQESRNSTLTTDRIINGHEWVDLGLPSGVKWATCNIGASSAEEYGDYYAWSETKTKEYYTADNCETFNKDNKWLLNKGYITSKGNLTPSYDAARQNWGATWRMPTKSEIDELITHTTTIWTTVNGVQGRMVKSKRNENSIFLPASGYRNGSMLYAAGKEGSYWSSTSDVSDSQLSYGPDFYASYFYWKWQLRFIGRSIRAVTD